MATPQGYMPDAEPVWWPDAEEGSAGASGSAQFSSNRSNVASAPVPQADSLPPDCFMQDGVRQLPVCEGDRNPIAEPIGPDSHSRSQCPPSMVETLLMVANVLERRPFSSNAERISAISLARSAQNLLRGVENVLVREVYQSSISSQVESEVPHPYDVPWEQPPPARQGQVGEWSSLAQGGVWVDGPEVPWADDGMEAWSDSPWDHKGPSNWHSSTWSDVPGTPLDNGPAASYAENATEQRSRQEPQRRHYAGNAGQRRQEPQRPRTLATYFTELRGQDPRRIFVVRGVSRLGFGSHDIVRERFSPYGKVCRVLVAPSVSVGAGQPRVRPGNLALVVMKDIASVERALAEGLQLTIGPCNVILQRFQHPSSTHQEASNGDQEGEQDRCDSLSWATTSL